MSGSPTGRRVAGLVLSGLLAGLALTGCTSAPADPATPTPQVTSAAPSPPGSSASATGPSAGNEPAPSADPDATEPNQVTIDITIADGQVSPNGKKIDVEVGQPIVLFVSSDQDDEIHAHTDGDGYELEVAAGTKVTGRFSVDAPGSYEVESHHLEKTIVILNAR